MKEQDLKLGIYEKALPKGVSWKERLRMAGELNFQFVEISIDETEERLARLEWPKEKRAEFRADVFNSGLSVPSMCFSGHRKFPLGSHNAEIRKKSRELFKQAIQFAADTGIRNVQLAGYDVYYDEEGDDDTRAWFLQGLSEGLRMAARENVMLSMEIMDTRFMSSIVRYLNIKEFLKSPWFSVYPDVGNLSAWGNDVVQELQLGLAHIAAIHLKDTLKVQDDFPGKFKEVPFGTGCVDFVCVFQCLKNLQYSGPFLIEMWTEKSEDPENEIRRAREWIIQKMKEGGYIDA